MSFCSSWVIFVAAIAGLANADQVVSSSSSYPTTVDNGDASIRVPQIIEKYGYPVEVHFVTTEDGFIIQLHRIPYGRKCGPAAGKRVAFLQHGLLADSSNWILSGPERALGYLLADDCYDVWMGNFRGNTYSRNHTTLKPVLNKAKFWRFSMNEMGIYDLPASLDYVLQQTGADGIYYTGHSMGTAAFFILMSEKPEYNSKIKLMNAMAPVSFMEHMISPIRLLSLIDGGVEFVAKFLGMYELLPSNALMEFMGQAFCKEKNPFVEMCNNILFLLAGYNYEQLDPALLPIFMGHIPAGTSVDTLLHFSQGVSSKQFQKFDFGLLKNMAVYGQMRPPKYDISKITAPVALWWGQNDWLASAKDVEKLAPLLPNLQLNHQVNPEGRWNHFDFMLGKDQKTLVNDPVMAFMKNY